MDKAVNKNIQVIVFDTRPLNPWLIDWFKRFKHVRFASTDAKAEFGSKDMVTCKRNRQMKWFLENTKLPWLLMLDDDVVPLDDIDGMPPTWPLIESTKDVMSAHFVAKKGNEAHGHKGDVAMTAVKVSRVALKRMKPPWTHFEFNEDETASKQCECDWFAGRAQDAGYMPMKAGYVGHPTTAVLVPLTDAERRMEKKKPEAMQTMCHIKLWSQLHKKGEKPRPKRR